MTLLPIISSRHFDHELETYQLDWPNSMPKPLIKKKYVDNKTTQLLLASQVIESKGETKTQRQARTPKQQTPRRPRSHKLDAIKVSISQKERDKRSARKKARQDQVEPKTSKLPSSSSVGRDERKATENKIEHLGESRPKRQRKQVTFA